MVVGMPRRNPLPPIRDRVEYVADETWRYRGWLIELLPVRGGWTAAGHVEDPRVQQRMRKAGYSESFNTAPWRWRDKKLAMAAAMSKVTYFERMVEHRRFGDSSGSSRRIPVLEPPPGSPRRLGIVPRWW